MTSVASLLWSSCYVVGVVVWSQIWARTARRTAKTTLMLASLLWPIAVLALLVGGAAGLVREIYLAVRRG